MTEAERREQIAQAAFHVFSERGYQAATMDEVSRHAGMSKKTVYQLFSNKAEIFDLLLTNWANPFVIPFEDGGRSQREVLTEALFRLTSFALAEEQIAVTRILITEAARPGDVADALERHGICRGDWALKQWLSSQTTLGKRRVDDPDELASVLFHSVAGDALLALLLRIRPRPTDADIVARIDDVLDLYFDAPAEGRVVRQTASAAVIR